MANAANTTPSKCFSGILRRLICSGSLPTHPSDDKFVELNIEQKPEEYSMEHRAANMKVEAASTPGVVARLMGLDSFPSSPFLAPKEKTTLGSFFRSRSVNSIDFLSHFDPIIIKQGRPHHHHRRVRTSVSFREGINDNFSSNVILRLKDTAEVEQPELLITRKTSPDINYYQHSKIVKGDRIRNREKLHEKRVTNKPSKKVEGMNQKKSSQKVDFHAKSTRHGRLKQESRQNVISNEELRKNSKGLKTKKKMVLSHEKVQSGCRMKRVHPQATVVPPEVCSRNNAASKIGKSERIPCSSSGAHSTHNGEIRAITKGKNERKMKSKESCYYKRMAEEICRLADEDVNENWMDGCKLEFEDFEDMCQHFGQEILQVLLQQFVDELVMHYQTTENN
ncbi:hypothetical protein ABFS82_12G175100 [Erythranthe guttata]|uniref:DUF3741 domain-containing protein n=1 Tax=Erythranthe guttata TaxID=4155 RepID=A0A022QHC4_ERYGU|nr:PREDICTED: uncharacterized protein LOC105969977 [Erythranthe guttata]EYU26673.1 hypothetical protein MIMGU_mgv1a007867mg [Erythranthe guttata]|eukprot:XP_012850203.1 PREDICTED: uncharacterized protein LOC105969977 [Erythranthe guttata]